MSFGNQLRQLGSKDKLRPGPLDRAAGRLRRPLDRAYERRATALESLARLSADVRASVDASPANGGSGPRVLVASLRGWSSHNVYETVIAHALRLRGADVALLTCGGGMPACELGWARHAHPQPCDRCAWLTDRVLEATGLEHFRLRELLPWGASACAAPADPPEADSADARELSAVSAMWLLKATQLDGMPEAAGVTKDFAVAADGVRHAAEAVLDRFEPDIVFLLNGLFGAERTIRTVALARGLRAPTYEIAPRGGALVLSQDAPAPDYDFDRLWASVRDRPLSRGQRDDVMHLLERRAHGEGAHESYYERPEQDPGQLRRHLDVSDGRHVVSLFTNVTWDSATIGHDIGFGSMFDWIEHAIRAAGEREDIVLVVRIHPAEARWGTREEVREVILSRIGEIPANVRFVTPGEALSSYALIDISDLILTYTTTVGLEAATRGKSVAVAGSTHYRDRGFTTDIQGPDHLAQALTLHGPAAGPETQELALRYAHMFFFRGMIPFPLVEADDGHVRRLPHSSAELKPGADRHLDWICARILDGEPFGLPDELAGVTLDSRS